MPEMFGRYELHDLLGRGGMGEVYRAVDTVRDRTVALKLLPHHLATDENFKTRFRRESRMAARLNDPHIIPIHDFGEIDGQLFIDMRLVEGRDLGSVLAERGALPPATGVKIISQVATALEAAHQAGLVHRDVKPSNVLLAGWDESSDPGDSEPFAYLVDFGIARAANQEGTALTATSGTVGTVAYMSPERIGGSPGDRRTDIYALGCVLYETIAGQKPFDGEMFAIMYAHMNNPPPRLTNLVPDSPPALDAVIAKAMAKEPEDRYATASEFALAARQALRTTPRQFAPPPQTGPFGGPPPQSGPIPPPGHPSGPLPYGAPPTSGPVGPPSGPVGPSGPIGTGAPYRPAAYTPPPSGPQRPPPQAPPPQGPPTGTGIGPSGPPSLPLPPQAQRPIVAQPPAAQHHTPVPVTPPTHAGPQTGAGQTAGGPPPGSVRPATPSQPLRSPSDWSPTTHPSGPVPQPTLPSSGSSGRKRGALIGAGVIAVVVAVVLALVFALGDGSPSAQHSGTDSGGPGSGTNSGAPVSYSTGGPSTPTVSWAHFGSYSELVGKRDGDTADAFQDANCKLTGKGTDDPDGLEDQVNCTYTNSPVTSTIARFGDKATVIAFLREKADHEGYVISPFKIGDRLVGLLFMAGSSATQIDLITYMCGLPNYLQQFYVPNKDSITEQVVQGNFWQNAEFPDVTPQACNSDFTGPASGSTPTMVDHGASKTISPISDTILKSYVQRQHPEWSVALVDVPSGAEIVVVGQKKTMSFWSWNKNTNLLSFDGYSTYPYDPKTLGQPQATARGAVLTGMEHATFIVTGQFSTDGSGNAVAYTTLDGKAWGAIKAQNDGNLKPTTEGVAAKAIGLSENFDFVNGQLETDDCTKHGTTVDCQNLITKFWKWDSSKNEFVLDHKG